MIIKNQSGTGQASKKANENNRRIRKFLNIKLISSFLLLLLIGGAYMFSVRVKSSGYNGLFDFISTYISNYRIGMEANPENISIEIKDKDLKILKKNREQALERGVIINELDGDYVSGTLEYKGKRIKIKLRLKGHMTDHLQNDKWSFRVKIKDSSLFMGMKRFSLQHPGTRGYIYEWIYHELMRTEELIALRYKFINVYVNGKDWGIYAVEENFEPELLQNNKRLKGPIIRFNPDMYWVNRYNLMRKQSAPDEFASYYSSNPEAYREENVLSDPEQFTLYMKALALIEGVRNRTIMIDQAFDIKQLAKFHAIIDLVGGQHSIDWSDIKYYYNPVSKLLEPVAYESFTTFPVLSLSGMYKFVELDTNENHIDWHTTLFSNPVFFKEYVAQLEKFSSPSYLDIFFQKSEKELRSNLTILFKEYSYKKFDKQTYYKNQILIRKMLNPPKQFHAYFDHLSDNNELCLQIGSIESLPAEIKAIHIGKIEIKLTEPILIPSKQENRIVQYRKYYFKVPRTVNWNNSSADSIQLIYALLGASIEKKQKVFSFPHATAETLKEDFRDEIGNIHKFSFLSINEREKIIFIKSGHHQLTEKLVIPRGYNVFSDQGCILDLRKGATLISYSPVCFRGSEDHPVKIISGDFSGKGLKLVNAGKSQFNFVFFNDYSGSTGISAYKSEVEFKNCRFDNIKTTSAIHLTYSPFYFKECLFKNVHNAINLNFSNGSILNCAFEDCDVSAVQASGSNVSVKSIVVNRAGKMALDVKQGSQFKGEGIKIKNTPSGVIVTDLSEAHFNQIVLEDADRGIVIEKSGINSGESVVKINGFTFNRVKDVYIKEEQSTIIVDGKTVNQSNNKL
jgi:hypothetical protein